MSRERWTSGIIASMYRRALLWVLAAIALVAVITLFSGWRRIAIHVLGYAAIVAAFVAMTLVLTFPIAFVYQLFKTGRLGFAMSEAARVTRSACAKVLEGL